MRATLFAHGFTEVRMSQNKTWEVFLFSFPLLVSTCSLSLPSLFPLFLFLPFYSSPLKAPSTSGHFNVLWSNMNVVKPHFLKLLLPYQKVNHFPRWITECDNSHRHRGRTLSAQLSLTVCVKTSYSRQWTFVCWFVCWCRSYELTRKDRLCRNVQRMQQSKVSCITG